MSKAYVYRLPLLLLLLAPACRKSPPPATEVIAQSAEKIPMDPQDKAWGGAPEHVAKLIPQDLVEPRLLKPSTPEVRIQSITDGSVIAFRIRWVDAAKNDAPDAGRFVDACAVQIPRQIDPNPPDPQMGQAGRVVDIVYWRADWQEALKGNRDSLRDLAPNASIDHYPFEARPLEPGSAAQREMATRYAPAAAAGNLRGGNRKSSVESLVAEGPGTLSPGPDNGAGGNGIRTSDGWSVVLSRRLPDGLSAGTRSQVAFAVWEGSQQEVGARKMRTGWIPLAIRGEQ
jgi:hypothetical protein